MRGLVQFKIDHRNKRISADPALRAFKLEVNFSASPVVVILHFEVILFEFVIAFWAFHFVVWVVGLFSGQKFEQIISRVGFIGRGNGIGRENGLSGFLGFAVFRGPGLRAFFTDCIQRGSER